MDSIFFEKTGRVYSTCRKCEHYRACGKDGVDGYYCEYCGASSEYMPFDSVRMDADSLGREIRHFMEDPMPEECPYFVQNSLASFDCGEDPAELAAEEISDYSRIVEGKCSDVDFSGRLFDRIRALDPSLDEWTKSHAEDGCLFIREDDGTISAFAAFAMDDEDADYSRIVPNGGNPFFKKGKRRLSIMNFAFDHERRPFAGIGIMKALFLKAKEMQADEMYAAAFVDEDSCAAFNGASMVSKWYAITSQDDDAAAKKVWARRIWR